MSCMIVKEVTQILEDLAPLPYAEDFDNVGLLVGSSQQKVEGILITLDTLEKTIDEAIENNCNLIVSFHPIIFSGLKSLTGKNYVERVVMRALKHDIAIYAIHTALDNVSQGMGKAMCDQLNLSDRKVLIPKDSVIKKLVTYIPQKEANTVKNALFAAGAGSIGNYEFCSFSNSGKGSFKGNEKSNPKLGKRGEFQEETEIQLHLTFEAFKEQQILRTLFETHPYEEVAYEVTTLNNKNQQVGLGMVGKLPKALDEMNFLKQVQYVFNAQGIRHSEMRNKTVETVAVLGGSGAFAIKAALGAGADALITADLKYHQFYEAEGKILLLDIGHYESEQFIKPLIADHLRKKISNFAIILSEDTNPIKYL